MKALFIRFIIIASLVVDATQIFAQTGTYFITHYNPAEFNFDNSNYELWQDDRGVMHIANRQGVLHYDGNGWWLTSTPYSIFCLAATEGRMYVGGREGLGMITIDGTGESKFLNLDTLHREIIKCVVLNDNVYYINSQRLFRFNMDNPAKIDTLATDSQELLDLVVLKGRIYLTTSDGLKEVTSQGRIDPNINIPEGAYFMRQSPNGSLLYLTDSSNIYIEIQNDLQQLAFDNKAFLDEHTVTEITWASNSLIAISTLSGGVLFVNVPSVKLSKSLIMSRAFRIMKSVQFIQISLEDFGPFIHLALV